MNQYENARNNFEKSKFGTHSSLLKVGTKCEPGTINLQNDHHYVVQQR